AKFCRSSLHIASRGRRIDQIDKSRRELWRSVVIELEKEMRAGDDERRVVRGLRAQELERVVETLQFAVPGQCRLDTVLHDEPGKQRGGERNSYRRPSIQDQVRAPRNDHGKAEYGGNRIAVGEDTGGHFAEQHGEGGDGEVSERGHDFVKRNGRRGRLPWSRSQVGTNNGIEGEQ